MSADVLAVFTRHVILAACLSWIVAFCGGASIRRGEGGAGAAVRIIATLVVPATALAFLGIFSWFLTLALSILAAWWQGVGSLGYLTDKVRDVWGALSLVSKAALLTVALAACLRAGAALCTPPLDGDSLLYHLPITAALLQNHSMWFTRALLYPASTELGEAIGGAAVGNVNGIVVFQLVQILALACVGFAWARRAGASIDGSAAAAVVACALPIVIDQMFTSQNDIFVCEMLAAGCVLWRPWPRLAATALGLVLAAKLTAFVLVPAIALVMVAFEGWSFSLSDLAWVAFIAAPWYARTWILTGTPLYTISSLGWSSTIAANFAKSLTFVIAGLRIYGGLATLGGIVALAAWASFGKRRPFARALPWLALAGFLAWIVLPNSAESVRGTLDQIRQGWSLRYALFVLFVLATGLPIVLDRVTKVPLAAFIALIAAGSAVVRSANLTASNEPLAFGYAAPLIVVLVCVAVVVLTRSTFSPSGQRSVTIPAAVLLGVALAVWSAGAVLGSLSMQHLWNASYLQWNTRIPTTAILLDKRVRASTKIAVLGMRSFPLAGPTFARRTYDDIVVQPPDSWLAALRRDGVPLLAAAGESGSPDERGFLQPLPAELTIRQSTGVCKLATHAYVRLYGLSDTTCS